MGKHGPFHNRLCLVTDIEGYSTHTTPQQDDAQQRLVKITQFALAHAQVYRVAREARQDRGDGQLLLMPPRLDQTKAIPALVSGLRHALYLSNQDPGPFGRIRMRAAVAQGAVAQGASGFQGQAPIVVCRLVDAGRLKDALKRDQQADLAFIATDDIYRDVIEQDFSGLPKAGFKSVDIAVKEYKGLAWMYLPASGPAVDPTSATALWASVAAGVVVAGLMSGTVATSIAAVPGSGLSSMGTAKGGMAHARSGSALFAGLSDSDDDVIDDDPGSLDESPYHDSHDGIHYDHHDDHYHHDDDHHHGDDHVDHVDHVDFSHEVPGLEDFGADIHDHDDHDFGDFTDVAG